MKTECNADASCSQGLQHSMQHNLFDYPARVSDLATGRDATPGILASLLLLACTLLVSGQASADSWNCRNNDLVREIVVEYPQGGALPCRVVYKKQTEGAEDKELWSAINQQGYCIERAKEFADKVESWGWTCIERQGEQETPAQ